MLLGFGAAQGAVRRREPGASNGCRMSTAAMAMTPAREEADAADLTARLRRGDAAAFESLVSLYQSRVARLARRLMGWSGDVDDIVQDVFLAALTKSRNFRAEASLWTWLTSITLNRCRTHHRRRLMRARLYALIPRTLKRVPPEVDQAATRDELAREVRAAVAALPATDREVIVLFYLEDRTAAQIGELLGASTNAIELRLHRARAKLRTRLETLVME